MDIKEVAVDTAKKAGRILRENLGRAGSVSFKGEVDLVTEMDVRSEDIIISEIRKAFPEHGILTEERGRLDGDPGRRWIIDPLDGTTNYAHGFPIFSVSIAFESSGEVVLGVVYNPMLDELFLAEKGNGARLNGESAAVSRTASLDKALLATGFPYDLRTSKHNNLDNFTAFTLKAQAIRRAGSAALDLSYVGCGRFDGFWEMKLKPWDTASAALFVREAGGVLTDFDGNPFSIHGKGCLASNGLIHAEMLAVLKGGKNP